ncbi:MAG: HAMP domain-containing histidine kinase [Clostridia bacterium]|nr:HAMP domain-containing histidine kinase [Clostridia bacterium]MBQ1934884.1 HAMP domain-containing histidine kinase [Clostridia bacterium]
MFKTIFSRLAAIFMLIIVISFTMIAFIITSLVGDYAVTQKTQTVTDAALSVKKVLELAYSGESEYNTDLISAMLSAPINNESVHAFLTDVSGHLIASNDITIQANHIPADIMLQAVSEKGFSGASDLGGSLPSNSIVSAMPILSDSGEVGAVVFVHTDSRSETAMLSSLLRTIVLSTMWVLIAMLLAIYFVSERTIGPLKSMSRAAKQFASGKLDVRVHVSGNDEIAELAVAFNSMAESIANMEKMRSGFLGNVSHDLRTPMTTISGFVDGILDGTIPKDKHEYYLRIISSEVKRLSRLVKALLDISRIQAGERKFKPEYFDICEMARQILISFEQMIDNKHLEVEFDIDKDSMVAYADVDAIHQVFYNICDNAVKFSREGGLLRVSVKSIEKKIHVFVYNEGSGIPEEDIPYVFERFYKTDKSRSLDRTGVGLGLFIARSVIEAHGEKIEVRSVQNEYCEFEFTLREGKEQRTRTLDLKPLQ